MRLFVALEVSPEARDEVRRRSELLRRRLPAARWVRPDGLHITLVFLGEIAEAALPALEAGLEAAAVRHPAPRLQLEDGGTFPPRRPARVAWIGVADRPPIAPLQGDLERAARAAIGAVGHAPDGRPYHPHLTLARCPDPWPAAAIATFGEAFAGPVGEAFTVPHATLFASHLGSGGSRYEELRRLPLLGGAV